MRATAKQEHEQAFRQKRRAGGERNAGRSIGRLINSYRYIMENDGLKKRRKNGKEED
jgi:hypothetical protein